MGETPESPQDHRERLAAFSPVLERTTACEPRPATRACAALGLQANLTVPLRELFEALVPLRWYKRLLGQGLDGRLRGAEAVLRSRDAKTPLTAPVDFVPSESLVLRRLAELPRDDPAWVAQGERWLSAMEALSSAFCEEGPSRPLLPTAMPSPRWRALVNQDPRLLELAEQFQDLEAGRRVSRCPRRSSGGLCREPQGALPFSRAPLWYSGKG